MKENRTGRHVGRLEKMIHADTLSEKPEKRNYLACLGVGRRILLKLILKEQGVKVYSAFI
jgi:hypothetical protein